MLKHSKSVSPKRLIKMLKDDGWVFQYQKGSHRMFTHPYKKGKITVPYQCSKNIELHVMRQAGIGRFKNSPQSYQVKFKQLEEARHSKERS